MKPVKNIIQRNLLLDTKYSLIDKCYIPIEYSTCCCDNCNKPISNIATVINESNQIFNIGFDCLETLLLNNDLLTNNNDYEKVKKMIPKIIRFAKKLNEIINNNKAINITGILFETATSYGDWFTFYWLTNNKTSSNNNESIKIKDIEFDFLISTLKNIFPKLQIIVK